MTGVELSSPDAEFVVCQGEASQRVDVLLSRRLTGCSRSNLKNLIKEGRVLVNGLATKPSYEVRTGDSISVRMSTHDRSDCLIPVSMPLDILYEDGDIVVINKAPGVVVHPGAGHRDGTLVHGLLAHCPHLATRGAPLRPGIVHRLDQHTSGALVVAKRDTAYLDLVDQFKRHSVGKEYLALVYGSFPDAAGEVRTLLGRHPADRKRMTVLDGRGREALTRWKVERAWEEITLLQVIIETGRTHQIRVHLSHLHHPVVGDVTYGGGKRRAQQLKFKGLRDLLVEVDRQMLHAKTLSFTHPRTREPLVFRAPLPGDFAVLLDQIESLFATRGVGADG